MDLQGEYLANHPLSLSETEENNAIKKAQTYGATKGVTGRLMTPQEVNSIINGSDSIIQNIIWGRWSDGTQPTQGYLFWWYGAASTNNKASAINGYGRNIYHDSYNSTTFGVRPVLEIL